MSLIKTVKDKLAEGISLKDIKHIIKRQKEGKALINFNRYAEELLVEKMLSEKKSAPDILAATNEKSNHFDAPWTEKRLTKLQEKVTNKPKKEKKVKAEPAPVAEPAAPVAEQPAKRRKKSQEV